LPLKAVGGVMRVVRVVRVVGVVGVGSPDRRAWRIVLVLAASTNAL